jgi:hypothetical protein
MKYARELLRSIILYRKKKLKDNIKVCQRVEYFRKKQRDFVKEDNLNAL